MIQVTSKLFGNLELPLSLAEFSKDQDSWGALSKHIVYHIYTDEAIRVLLYAVKDGETDTSQELEIITETNLIFK
jgi:hypothetical protein|tara:strand:- start:493 stop:717 length:225 start_codon:yes stop_codon:yes gene_type:complete